MSVKPLCLATTLLTTTKGIPVGLESDPGADELLTPEPADLDPATGGDAGAGIGIAPLVAELNMKICAGCIDREGARGGEHQVNRRRGDPVPEVALEGAMLLDHHVVGTDGPIRIAIHEDRPARSHAAARDAGAGAIRGGTQRHRHLPLEGFTAGGNQAADEIVGRTAHAVVGSEGGKEGCADTEGDRHDAQHHHEFDEAEALCSLWLFLLLFLDPHCSRRSRATPMTGIVP